MKFHAVFVGPLVHDAAPELWTVVYHDFGWHPGRRFGVRRRPKESEGERGGLGAIEGAVFALFGLMVAFTFSGAATRFNEKRMLVAEEVNCIETAYLRVHLLSHQTQPAIQELFRRYVDSRLETYRKLPDMPAAEKEIAKSKKIQEEIWNQAVAATRLPDSHPASGLLLLPALNNMYGAVPLRTIKKALLDLKAEGKLDRARLLVLTNCTFDGHIYNVERVMEECLAIKPDLIFLWDEAWFGFARWSPFYRRRTAMGAAAILEDKFKDPAYRAAYKEQETKLGADFDPKDKNLLAARLLADPDKVRLRVYQTNSTHKSMSCLRQGSMVLVKDPDFHTVEEQFHEA